MVSFWATVPSALSSNLNVEDAKEIRGLGNHFLKEAQLATIQVSLLNKSTILKKSGKSGHNLFSTW